MKTLPERLAVPVPFARRAAFFIESCARALSPLWVTGLAVLLLFIVEGTGLEGKALDWRRYMVLGTVFPALVVLLLSLRRYTGVSEAIRCALGAGCIAGASAFAAHHFESEIPAFVLAAAATIVILAAASVRENKERLAASDFSVENPPPLSPRLLVNLFILAMAGLFCAQLLTGGERFQTWLGSFYSPWVLAPVFFLVFLNLAHGKSGGIFVNSVMAKAGRVGDAAAVILIAVMSFRTDRLFGPDEVFTSFHHWGYFVGPAELVRQGGWLLWDVPSQYGFLSILTVALFPARSAWQSFYVVNSLLLFAAACFLYFLLRSLRSGWTNYWFSLAVTLAVSFFLPAGHLLGPQIYPSIGAFRFFWCYALIAILLLDYRAARAGTPQKSLRWIGCGVWVIGSLWSAESATYAAGIWLPAYALIVWRDAPGSFRHKVRKAAGWLLVPPAFLAAALSGLVAYYLTFLGHAPDYRSFFEFALAFQSGRIASVSIPLSAASPIMTHLIVFCAVTTAVAHFVRNGLFSGAALACGAWAVLWTTSSYYVVRGDGLTYASVLPMTMLAISVILFLFRQESRPHPVQSAFKAALFPLFSLILVTAFGSTHALRELAGRLETFETNIESHLPVIGESAGILLEQGGVGPGDPIVYIDKTLDMLPARIVHAQGDAHRQTFAPAWIPIKPFAGTMPPILAEQRIKLYMSRFTERLPQSGYLLIKANISDLTKDLEKMRVFWGIEPPAWLFEQLEQTHDAQVVASNADYELIWFGLKPYSRSAKHSVMGLQAASWTTQ